MDGVVIVAAAGQTRRDEIRRAGRVVEMAQGKVLGYVLNKRKYPVPNRRAMGYTGRQIFAQDFD